ncbi:hypothetical protein ADK54_30215 [Streptomyces sp. WM6378]|nr:hypothetical protein ADK54_30215 [Streptomyces sp. WM6378]
MARSAGFAPPRTRPKKVSLGVLVTRWSPREAKPFSMMCSAGSGRREQKLNAQLTRGWWRRMAVLERTWKSAQPSSFLTGLWLCSTQCRSPQIRTISVRSAGG